MEDGSEASGCCKDRVHFQLKNLMVNILEDIYCHIQETPELTVFVFYVKIFLYVIMKEPP